MCTNIVQIPGQFSAQPTRARQPRSNAKSRPNPPLHRGSARVTLRADMLNPTKALLCLLVPLLLAGCTTTPITNLTPSRLPRKDNGQYPFAVEWNSYQQSLIKDSIKAFVILGLDQHPLQ